jgi:hypothetical protein
MNNSGLFGIIGIALFFSCVFSDSVHWFIGLIGFVLIIVAGLADADKTAAELKKQEDIKNEKARLRLLEIQTQKEEERRLKNFNDSNAFEVTGVHISDRKKYITYYCQEYDMVTLTHEKNNTYSNRAIVVKHNNKRIGYISENDLEYVHDIIKNNYEALITSIDFDGSYLNVIINIEYHNPIISDVTE